MAAARRRPPRMNGSRRKLASGNWQVRWINPDGTPGSRTLPNAQAAERVLAKVRAATGSGERPFAAEVPSLALADAVEAVIADRAYLADNTKTLDRWGLTAMAGHALLRRDMNTVTTADVVALLEGIDSDEQRRRATTLLSHAYVRAAGTGEATVANPVTAARSELRRRRTTRSSGVDLEVDPADIISPQQAVDLADAIGPQYRGHVLIGAGAGVRYGEMAALNRDDFTFGEAPSVRIDKAQTEVSIDGRGSYRQIGPPKTRQSNRRINLSVLVAADLDGWMIERGVDQIAFPTVTGKRLQHSNFTQRVWRPALQRVVGHDRWTYHTLRHLFASALITDGISLQVVSKQLGHADPAITARVYARLWADASDVTRAAMDRQLGGLLGAPTSRE